MIYEVTNPAGAQLWTKAANKAGIMPYRTQFASNSNLTIKDRLCRLVESGGYAGKYAQASDVTIVLEPEPPTQPPGVELTHSILVYSDGSIWIDGNPYP